MKQFLCGLLALLLPACLQAQDASTKNYRNFPIVIGLHFQNLAMPLRDLKSNFRNIGITIGTEVSHNGRQNWAQQFQVGVYRNAGAGNGFLAYTQTVYRPTVLGHFYPEIKAGIGWQRIFHPVKSYQFQHGVWEQSTGGKSQLIVPLGVSVGYNGYRQDKTYFSPFVSYQILPALFYNKGIPLNFYSAFQVGTRIHTR